ncbi:oligosaccharyl transferase, archaeosortase A system-associated [Natronococcus occultus]|uniref:dolichyl-phosphooligosaccharide-protein glycotransferase n=1 Tax=Natronococcus occultus SP4 TaxID=694430 RepID=L0K092_9EURY|nr:oligosaccharyl transferase, archaeosortase A system-associated [Natronococcus occultus]AGB38411.1 putative membrane protein, required for N-linked glycosylation [Natronococcus occultus SP4]
MSTETERAEERTESSVLGSWAEWYHVPVVGAVMLFMFWVRTQSYEAFLTEDGTPALAGIDSWYHWRTIQWTAENYPQTMPYEVWTGFPTGNYVGQFGTLFDQLIVTAAMIVGLGDPSSSTLYTVSLFAVPAMAALVAIPVFYLGRRLGGTVGGLVAVVLLALAPGQFLVRTTAGQLQHHVAEVLFMALAVLGMAVALRVAEREQPIYELAADRNWAPLREPTLYSVLAGVALALYIWVWPPGVVLIGIFGVFFAIQLCLDYVRGISPDHVAFVGAVSLGVTAVATALLIEEPGTSVTSFGYLQPGTAALVAVGCLFMAWFARQWNARGIDRRLYPGAIAALIVGTFAVMWLVLPEFYDTLVGNLTGRIIPLDPDAGTLTIQEAQPPEDFTAHVFDEFGTAFYTMLAGLVLLAARPLLGREHRAEYTLILVWSLFLLSMSATQIRFSYYLVLAVAVVNAAFVADVLRLFDLDLQRGTQALRGIETYQIIILFVVVVLLFAPLLPVVAADGDTAVERGEATGPHPDAMVWEESTHWLEANTPEPGNYGGADYADELEYYGSYDYPEDGDFDYPAGAYGVMSWWDYGHLITTQAERIPHSNPFQQNAETASAYLTAESEREAELILEAIAAGEDPLDDDDNVRPLEELETAIEDDADEQLRYVMIDDQMAGGKFSAMTAWSGPDYDHYVTPDVEPGESIDREDVDDRLKVPYEETMVADLYFDDATGMDHYRLVHENDERTAGFVSYALIDPETDEVLTDETGQHQVAFNQPLQQAEVQLSQFEQSPDVDVEYIDDRETAGVKTYERVAGATIVGTADADADEGDVVTAELELDSGTDRGSFTYEQETEVDADGEFELTVPYATDDELDVEDGYTESAVEAVDDYTVTVEGETPQEGDLEVPESAVVDGETVEVELEETELEDAENDGATEDETDGDDADAAEADTETADEDADDAAANDADAEAGADDAGADDTASSLAPAAGLAD